MSIPKEPRQLMINLMYLVLTAMLALNVSAEIFNAFDIIDDGLNASNASFDEANTFAMTALTKNAEQDQQKYGRFVTVGKDIQSISNDFYSYVEEIKDSLIDYSGGMYPTDYERSELAGKPIGYKNKDITTNMLVNRGVGEELKAEIERTRQELIDQVRTLVGSEPGMLSEEQFEELLPNITLAVDSTWQNVKRPVSWSHFTFRHMPVGSVLPILSKFQNDMQGSEAGILNYLLRNLGVETFKVDAFQAISSPKKSYVIAGEPFETNITIGASSSSVTDNMVVRVGGQRLDVDPATGTANYRVTSGSVGIKNYTVEIDITNPTTGEQQTVSQDFSYEVGRRSVTVSPDKMNVLYMGVDNPISVSAAGVSSNKLRVSGSGAGIAITRAGNGKYIATVKAQGKANITVSGEGMPSTSTEFRVKRIPDPVARLGNEDSGPIKSGIFKAQIAVIAHLDNFDFDARCRIVGYNVVRVPKSGDVAIRENSGERFSTQVAQLIQRAKPGDTYYFEEVKARCPGDPGNRKINPINIKVR